MVKMLIENQTMIQEWCLLGVSQHVGDVQASNRGGRRAWNAWRRRGDESW